MAGILFARPALRISQIQQLISPVIAIFAMQVKGVSALRVSFYRLMCIKYPLSQNDGIMSP